jgi:hypothetical protein
MWDQTSRERARFAEGKAKGIVEGTAKGIAKARLEDARKMKSKGCPAGYPGYNRPKPETNRKAVKR